MFSASPWMKFCYLLSPAGTPPPLILVTPTAETLWVKWYSSDSDTAAVR